MHGKPKDDEELVLVDATKKGNHIGAHDSLRNSRSTSQIEQDEHSNPSITQLALDDLERSPLNESRNHIYNPRRNKLAAKRLLSLAKKRKPQTNGVISSSQANNDMTHLVTKMSDKIMVKLDQINLKLNQLNDRMYVLERKLELLEDQ